MRVLASALVLPALVVVGASAAARPQVLAFKPVARGFSPTPSSLQNPKPDAIVILAASASLGDLIGATIGFDTYAQLPTVDFRKNALVAAIVTEPTGGRRIAITRITLQPLAGGHHQLCVIAATTEEAQSGSPLYAYDIVKIAARATFDPRELSPFVLRDTTGKLLGSNTYGWPPKVSACRASGAPAAPPSATSRHFVRPVRTAPGTIAASCPAAHGLWALFADGGGSVTLLSARTYETVPGVGIPKLGATSPLGQVTRSGGVVSCPKRAPPPRRDDVLLRASPTTVASQTQIYCADRGPTFTVELVRRRGKFVRVIILRGTVTVLVATVPSRGAATYAMGAGACFFGRR